MSEKQHSHIPKLKQEFAEGKIDRREFLRYSTLLGMSAAAAYAFVGKVTGETFVKPAKAMMPKGGNLKISMRVHEVEDAHTYSWVRDSNVARQVCGYLTQTGHDNVTRPYLVEGWEVSDDLRTWTLKTRKNVKWHNGRQFTSEDAAWNLRHALDPKTGSSVVGLMKGYMLNETSDGSTELWDANAIEVVDENTLRLNLKVPQVAVPEHLFHYPMIIVDPEDGGKFGVGSNGTEAFDLVEHRVGEKSVLRARSDYWGEGPYLDTLTYVDLGDDPSAAIGAMASGQVDGIEEGDITQLDVFKGIPGAVIHSADTAQTAVARVQIDREEFKDARVRKAMRLAVDSNTILQIAHRGLGKPAEHHHVSPIHPDYFPLPEMKRDVAAAKALLADAGFPNGVDVEINTKQSPSWELTGGTGHGRAVEGSRHQRVNINLMPSAQFWDNWDKVPFGFTSWTHRPLGFMVLGLAYRSGVPWNESRYANPKFDEILTKAEGTLDVEERKLLIKELQIIMQEDGPIVQPIWRAVFSVMNEKVKGWQQHPTSYIFGHQLAKEA